MFKWFVGSYLIYFIINIGLLFNIPAEDDRIFRTEATSQFWSKTPHLPIKHLTR